MITKIIDYNKMIPGNLYVFKNTAYKFGYFDNISNGNTEVLVKNGSILLLIKKQKILYDTTYHFIVDNKTISFNYCDDSLVYFTFEQI